MIVLLLIALNVENIKYGFTIRKIAQIEMYFKKQVQQNNQIHTIYY